MKKKNCALPRNDTRATGYYPILVAKVEIMACKKRHVVR